MLEANTSGGSGSATDTIGLSGSFSYTSNANSVRTNFSTLANFYETTGTPHAHNGFYSSRVSNQPYAFDPIDDLDGTPVLNGNEAFEFECLDGAFDIKHRLRVFIREWNTFSDFLLYQTTSGVTENSDVSGTEGDDCDYSTIFGGNCNDFRDFKDVLNSAGGSYNTTPGITPAARASYFPNIDY